MTAADSGTSASRLADPADPAEQAAAEEASAFGHPPVPPDATAAYGGNRDQVIDFYRPRGPGVESPAPLVALLHGGAWRQDYDRAHISPLAAHLAAQGFAVASVEYRRGGIPYDPQQALQGAERLFPVRPEVPEGPPSLSPAGRWPETFDDVAAAVDALPALALRALGAGAVDPERVVLSGHSAGGHLVLWAAARHLLPPDSPWHLSSPPPLRGVVALAPIADLTSAIRLRVCSGAVDDLLGGSGYLTGRIAHADPAGLLPTGIATTIVHGTTDNVVPVQVSEAFVSAAAAAGEEPGTAWLPATGHFPLIDPASPAVAVVIHEINRIIW